MRIFLFSIVLLLTLTLDAQYKEQDSTLYSVQTMDGNSYIGKIIEREVEYIVLETKSYGELKIMFSNIRQMARIEKEDVVNNSYWIENPQATRYFWGPNAHGLKKGEGYYQNVWIFFNQFVFGLSENFSVGLGTVPLFLFAGTESPFWITPRVSFPVVKDKISIGGGALLGTVVGLPDSGFGIVYGNTTIGDRDQNLTIGLGWGYADGSMADRPTVTFSGMTRIGPKAYLLTENYYIDDGFEGLLLLSFGGRSLINKVSLDYGLVIPREIGYNNEFFAIPWLGLVVPFGKKVN